MKLLGVLEGILFVVGDEGINLNVLCETMDISPNEVQSLLKELKSLYENENRGLKVSYLGDAFKLTTKKEHKDYFVKLVDNPETNTLSLAALETLAIIAYNEPVTRMEVDHLRGVNTSHMLRKLVARGLIKEAGKSPLPGKPNLYVTTKEFLDYFGLATKEDLPKFDIEKLDNNQELFESIYKEEQNQ